MQVSSVLTALAAAFVVSETIAVLAVSLGLWEASLVSRVFGLFSKRRAVGAAKKAPALAPQPPQPPVAAAADAHEPEAPQPEPSASTQPSATALEPSGPSSLAPHALDGLPSEVSFTYANALAQTTSEEGSGGGASGGASELPLAAVAEGSGSEGEDGEEDEDSFDSCTELTFEPSAAGAPGVTFVQRSISGLAVRTLPTSTDPGSPLLVNSYQSRFVEVVNGCVKEPQAEIEAAYVSQPLQVAAHSPRRTASRALGRLASGASLSTSPSSIAS
ncbi:hypothetical protein C2E21_6895 [Chlorella sorokiniana]|uniref:Uncharacterized protein n=1 Tax=Chlorella sorokiniana TaxID=3076 RepID=A0A2P6TJ88_CHLSO|nr:hypothetical protein C2E21_6895 [Chlorella sorokiniana]|eukprot:PRW39316.1 hypothetical protein C2E21_6895 [Chlorella sorokiniana]